jgi:LPXTG-motif cell wall-anchored protein
MEASTRWSLGGFTEPMIDWMTENFWILLLGGIVVLLVLIGILYYLRNKRED